MTTCKGNKGNLLQHWTFCEIIDDLKHLFGKTARLDYIDTHSMAPFSTVEKKDSQTRHHFERCRNRLPGERSVYELAWHDLTRSKPGLYPSSAAFMTYLWHGPLSFSVCEIDDTTADAIDQWWNSGSWSKTWSMRLHRGSWRDAGALSLTDCDIRLVQCDPDRFETHRDKQNGRVMYVGDMEKLCGELSDTHTPTIVMLSSYSAQNDNSISTIQGSLVEGLGRHSFQRAMTVKADGNMVSFVFQRGFPTTACLSGKAEEFTRWLNRVTSP